MTEPHETETQPMRHRPEDPPLKITREIPLPWILGVLGAFFIFAATMYFTQQRQAELLVDLKTQVQKLVDGQDVKGAKDQDRDLDIRELKGRVAALERDRAMPGMMKR